MAAGGHAHRRADRICDMAKSELENGNDFKLEIFMTGVQGMGKDLLKISQKSDEPFKSYGELKNTKIHGNPL